MSRLFTSAYRYELSGSPPNFTIAAAMPHQVTASNADSDDGPGSAGVLTLSDESRFHCVGFYRDGWIGRHDPASRGFVFFSNDQLPVGMSFAAATAPPAAAPPATSFLAGTRIAVPGGEWPIESLAIGDLVLGADGLARPVRWIGRRRVVAAFADPLSSFPIRIAAGALAENRPARDLYLSPDHGLLLDGLLVQAATLVNGSTITRLDQPGERFTYFHIEFADHAVLLAEGAPAESFAATAGRRRFDNYSEYDALYGAGHGSIAEMDLPRVKSVRQLPPALRRRLNERAAMIGRPAVRESAGAV